MNDKIYDNTDLSSLVNSLEQYGQLEPIVINQKNTIISGHRRFYSMIQLEWKKADVIVKDFESDIIALIQYNEHRQKSGDDYKREQRFLLEEQKKYKQLLDIAIAKVEEEREKALIAESELKKKKEPKKKKST